MQRVFLSAYTCPQPPPLARNHVVVLFRLCKPPLNPLSHDVRAGILHGLQQAQGDDAVSLVVITGGSKAFSAGADIKEMADGHAVRRSPDLLTVVAAIEACRVPVVAAIGGVALGGGCEVRGGRRAFLIVARSSRRACKSRTALRARGPATAFVFYT